MEDTSIVEMIYHRDEEGLSALSEKYGREMRSVAFRVCHSKEDAEEVFNDALVGVWSAIPPEWPRILSSYVFRIVRNLASKVVRKAHAEKRVEAVSMDAIMEELGDVFADDGNVSDGESITAALNRFTAGCSETDQFLFMRRYFYYDSIAVIASQQHMTEGAVMTRLSRIRSRLKEFLEGEGIGL